MKEFDLYPGMCEWLKNYLNDRYNNYSIIVEDTHSVRLDRALRKHGIELPQAIGIDIEIDILGIAKKGDKFKLFFIEAKKTQLTLRDLGQLWSYCKLIDPEEAFLMTSNGFGSLDKILRALSREDLLDFGDGKKIKKMKVAYWDTTKNAPDMMTMIPKI